MVVFLVNYVSEKKQQRIEAEAEILKSEKLASDYEFCKSSAYDYYSANWSVKCEFIGKDSTCDELPEYYAKSLGGKLSDDLNFCLDVYKTLSLIK